MYGQPHIYKFSFNATSETMLRVKLWGEDNLQHFSLLSQWCGKTCLPRIAAHD